MSWNYRIVRTQDPDGSPLYAIHEAYYDKLGSVASITTTPVAAVSETRGGLLNVLAQMADAYGQPVLDMDRDVVEPGRIMTDDMHRVIDQIKAECDL